MKTVRELLLFMGEDTKIMVFYKDTLFTGTIEEYFQKQGIVDILRSYEWTLTQEYNLIKLYIK